MNAAALPFIVQIAFFGAAGTAFISAHLKNLAADRLAAGQSPAERWRVFRLPNRRGREKPEALKLRRAALVQIAWGTVLLGLALVVRPALSLFT